MLVTLKSLKNYLGLDHSDPAENSFLTELELSAKKRIESYCDQPLEAGARTIEYNGNSTNWMMLKHKPVTSITSIKERDEPTDDWEDAIDSDKYKLVEKDGIYRVYYKEGYTSGDQNYQFVYNSGYTSIPEDLQQVAKEMVMVSYRESFRGESALGKKTISKNLSGMAENTTFEDLWENRWTKVLNNYSILAI